MKTVFLGWCKEDSHDKIWGVVQLDSLARGEHTYGTFWGRRGKTLQTKIVKGYEYEMDKTIDSKQNKGYNTVSDEDSLYPEFKDEFEKVKFKLMLMA